MGSEANLPVVERARPTSAKAWRWAGGTVLLGMSMLCDLASADMLRQLASWLTRLFLLLATRQRSKIRGNLRQCLGDKLSEAQLRKLEKEFVEQLLWGLLLGTCRRYATREVVCQAVGLRGKEHLDRALSNGRGVIAIGAHVGPIVLLSHRMSVEGYPYSVVMRLVSDSRVAGYIQRLSAASGVRMHYRAPRDVSVLYALRRGEVVHLYLDQHAAEGGVVVEFFGQPMPAFAGPAVLARLLRCPVLPIFIVPEGRNRWTAEIGPAFDLQWSDDKDADILRATQAFVRAIERVVRRYPEQWMWMNSCWLRPDDRPRLCLPELLERIPPAVRQSLSVDVNTQHRARPPAHD